MLHQPSKVKRVIVTGGRGFIGSHVVSHLRKVGYDVYAPLHGTMDCLDQGSIDRVFDIREVGSDTCVIHAAVAPGGNRVDNPSLNTLTNNLRMYQNVQQAAETYGATFINFCSGAAFNRELNTIEIRHRETDILFREPKDFYGLAKNLIARDMLTKKNVLNLRLFGCFGFGEPGYRFISTILNQTGSAAALDVPEKYMSFFYVKDVARVVEDMIPWIRTGLRPADINLCYREVQSLRSIAKQIHQLTGQEGEPVFLSKVAATESYVGDAYRLQQFAIPLVGFEAGLREMITEMESKTGKRLVK